MAVPSNRKEFKEYVLRSLGAPVIEINVSDEQVEDRIDQALRFYWDYHFDGSEKVYFKQEVTQEILDTQQIVLPENIIGAIRIFEPSTQFSSKDMFNIQYQIALNDMHTIAKVGTLSYYMTMEQLSTIQEIFVGQTPIRYNRHRNILHIDKDMSRFTLGSFIVVEAYEVVDPALYADVWADRWLQYYVSQLVKREFGFIISKYEGIQLPGGVTFNGQKIYDDADAEVKRLEEEMIESYSIPPLDMMG